MMTLSGLNIYPVKSLAGISVSESMLDRFGLAYDRRWMVVKPNGHFITQRTRSQMALIHTFLDDEGLLLSHPELGECRVPAVGESSPAIRVQVWDDLVDALHVSKSVDAWLSRAVGETCHLVWFPENEQRQCDESYANKGDMTGFTDGFPLLLISQASLDDLNSRLKKPVEMRRFRPNLVVDGCEPFAEDKWKKVRIGDASFRVVKPCSRCVLTTVDPETGQRSGAEPLQTLAGYRKQGSKVFFGQNLVHDDRVKLKLGDQLEVLEE